MSVFSAQFERYSHFTSAFYSGQNMTKSCTYGARSSCLSRRRHIVTRKCTSGQPYIYYRRFLLENPILFYLWDLRNGQSHLAHTGSCPPGSRGAVWPGFCLYLPWSSSSFERSWSYHFLACHKYLAHLNLDLILIGGEYNLDLSLMNCYGQKPVRRVRPVWLCLYESVRNLKILWI